MQRHADLHPLSEHHHHALVLALEIRRAAELPAPERDQRLRSLADSVLHFWGESGQTHFAEEEQVLLPKYARHFRLDEDPEIMRMLADHAAIRARIEDVRDSLGGTFSPSPSSRSAPCFTTTSAWKRIASSLESKEPSARWNSTPSAPGSPACMEGNNPPLDRGVPQRRRSLMCSQRVQ